MLLWERLVGGHKWKKNMVGNVLPKLVSFLQCYCPSPNSPGVVGFFTWEVLQGLVSCWSPNWALTSSSLSSLEWRLHDCLYLAILCSIFFSFRVCIGLWIEGHSRVAKSTRRYHPQIHFIHPILLTSAYCLACCRVQWTTRYMVINSTK